MATWSLQQLEHGRFCSEIYCIVVERVQHDWLEIPTKHIKEIKKPSSSWIHHICTATDSSDYHIIFAFFLAVQVDMLRSEGPKLHQNKPFHTTKTGIKQWTMKETSPKITSSICCLFDPPKPRIQWPLKNNDFSPARNTTIYDRPCLRTASHNLDGCQNCWIFLGFMLNRSNHDANRG